MHGNWLLCIRPPPSVLSSGLLAVGSFLFRVDQPPVPLLPDGQPSAKSSRPGCWRVDAGVYGP